MTRPRLTMREFSAVVRDVIRELPKEFRKRLDNLVVDVELWPQARLLNRLGMNRRDKYGLLGLFVGRPLTEQGCNERSPNLILLFKRPIEAASRSRDEIRYEIRRTILHELGHHFGLSEDDLRGFEATSPFLIRSESEER